ncbi:sensor histidine kinase [Cnuibacter sp. UC19_7]|uniref:sensor histidine kinase n=1 Tax=Cnuibacter sp. UC19_7 TaxID=3350166 RepID=UPI00366AC232
MGRGAVRHRIRPAGEERRLTDDLRESRDLRLPKPPGFIRTFFARHPWLLDVMIAAVYSAPAAIFTLVVAARDVLGGGPLWPTAVAFYITLLVTGALVFRRYVPHVTAGVAVAVFIASYALGTHFSPGLTWFPVIASLYALAVYRSSRAAWIWTAVASGAAIVCSIVVETDPITIIGFSFMWTMSLVIATLVGITFGNRRRYIQALLDRAWQLARERDQQAQIATAAERARIAREMHDIVAHSLTVIVALSDGAEASIDRSPEVAREAVRQSASTARRALADMRRSLGVLTSDRAPEPGELAPQPGLSELPELIESYRSAGLPVRFTERGPEPADPVTQLTVFRVVQEALTNALRYALEPTAVDVDLDYGADRIRISVTDDGREADRRAVSVGSGSGLIGMRERVAVHGGTVSAGPVGVHGWRVTAEFDARGEVAR